MKLSYDYEEFLQEIKEELEDGILNEEDRIYILRSDNEIGNGYKPIIDWYYLDDKIRTGEIVNVADCIAEMEELNSII